MINLSFRKYTSYVPLSSQELTGHVNISVVDEQTEWLARLLHWFEDGLKACGYIWRKRCSPQTRPSCRCVLACSVTARLDLNGGLLKRCDFSSLTYLHSTHSFLSLKWSGMCRASFTSCLRIEHDMIKQQSLFNNVNNKPYRIYFSFFSQDNGFVLVEVELPRVLAVAIPSVGSVRRIVVDALLKFPPI